MQREWVLANGCFLGGVYFEFWHVSQQSFVADSKVPKAGISGVPRRFQIVSPAQNPGFHPMDMNEVAFKSPWE